MPLRRLDAEARVVVDLANDIAHEYELEFVGTEHVLLAIFRHGQNPAARALARLGVTAEQVQTAVDDLIQRAKEDTWVFGRLPCSPHYRNVIERAMEIAEQLEAPAIGAAHILLALYHDKDSAAQRMLVDLGATPRKCRDAVLRELGAA